MNGVSPIKLNEIARIAELIEAMCDGDEVLFADMMEAEAPAHDIINRLSDAVARDQERLAGIKDRAAALAERKARYEARIEVISVRADPIHAADGTLLVEIEYRVRRTNQTGNMVFPFYFREGGAVFDEGRR